MSIPSLLLVVVAARTIFSSSSCVINDVLLVCLPIPTTNIIVLM